MRPTADSVRRVISRVGSLEITPDPPRGPQFAGGVLWWEPPKSMDGVTHFRVYADNELNLVREVPAGQRFINDNLTATQVFITSYNAFSQLESTPVRMPIAVTPANAGGVPPVAKFNIAVNGPVSVGLDVPPRFIFRFGGTPDYAQIEAKFPPTGSDLIIDCRMLYDNGDPSVSIFGDTKLVLPAGSTSVNVQTTFAPDIVATLNDRLIADVSQVGSTYPGSCIVAYVWWKPQ